MLTNLQTYEQRLLSEEHDQELIKLQRETLATMEESSQSESEESESPDESSGDEALQEEEEEAE